jgi:hypothetical protein
MCGVFAEDQSECYRLSARDNVASSDVLATHIRLYWVVLNQLRRGCLMPIQLIMTSTVNVLLKSGLKSSRTVLVAGMLFRPVFFA